MAGRGLSILILAAGASSRMGVDKLLLPLRGRPLLRHVADVALSCGLPVTVVLPAPPGPRAAVLERLCLMQVTGGAGMGDSLSAGVGALPEDHAVLVMLADMPDIGPADLMLLTAAHRDDPQAILRASNATGDPGHPVLFPADLRPALLSLRGDTGARAVIAAHPERLRPVPLPGNRALCDWDTPEDRARWLASGGQ